jgi:protein SCO1/2
MKKHIRILFISGFVAYAILSVGCEEKFPLNKNLTSKSYSFFNQDSLQTEFTDIIKGKITVIGFIYTNCPDICPMTTHNMYLTQQKLEDENINDVNFVGLTFDPHRDIPSVLKKFGQIREIDFSNWTFLWGNDKNTNELMERFDVRTIFADSIFIDDELNYSVMHTDRISLVGKDGRLKKNYKGSTVNIDELYNDILTLKDE